MKKFLSLLCVLLACLLTVGCAPSEPANTEQPSATESAGVTNATESTNTTEGTGTTNATEASGQTAADVPVETLRTYTKKYIPYDYGDGVMGDSTVDHSIRVPNVVCDSVDALRINEKLQSVCNAIIEILEKNEEENGVYRFDYAYKYHKGILGLVQQRGYGYQSAGSTTLYDLYYLDMTTGKGLTYSEYVTALGMTEDSVLDALRASGVISTEDYPDWVLAGLITDSSGSLIVIQTAYTVDGIACIETDFSPLK